jgi:hypothetical protein
MIRRSSLVRSSRKMRRRVRLGCHGRWRPPRSAGNRSAPWGREPRSGVRRGVPSFWPMALGAPPSGRSHPNAQVPRAGLAEWVGSSRSLPLAGGGKGGVKAGFGRRVPGSAFSSDGPPEKIPASSLPSHPIASYQRRPGQVNPFASHRARARRPDKTSPGLLGNAGPSTTADPGTDR